MLQISSNALVHDNEAAIHLIHNELESSLTVKPGYQCLIFNYIIQSFVAKENAQCINEDLQGRHMGPTPCEFFIEVGSTNVCIL